MRHERAEIGPAGRDARHQAAHPLLAAGAQAGDDRVVAQAGGKDPSRTDEALEQVKQIVGTKLS